MIQRWRNLDITGDVTWLMVSVLLATGVWYIAVTSADPIGSRRFQRVPVQLAPSDAALVITYNPTRFVTVTVQGSQGTVSSRRSEDIVVRADLAGLGPGTHTVPLEVDAAGTGSIRPLVAQSQPSQITVTLELRESFQKELVIIVTQPPPIGFRHDDPVADVRQVIVSGASSIVSRVAAVQGDLDLSGGRNPIETDLRLYAVDADGNRVNNVELELQTTAVSVNITRRDDIRQIAVSPDILADTQPEGFNFFISDYEPQSLFISGDPKQLAELEDTLPTKSISLENQQSDFKAVVPVVLPDDDLIVLGSDNKITVSIRIVPIPVVRQFDVEVGVIGLGAEYTASIFPQSVSVTVDGPVSLVAGLSSADIQVIVDLDSLAPGVYEREPSISISRGESGEATVSLLPEAVNVEIALLAPDVEATGENGLLPLTPDADAAD